MLKKVPLSPSGVSEIIHNLWLKISIVLYVAFSSRTKIKAPGVWCDGHLPDFQTAIFLFYPPLTEKSSKALCELFCNALIPFMRTPLSWPNYFPKTPPPLSPSYGSWDFNIWIWRSENLGEKSPNSVSPTLLSQHLEEGWLPTCQAGSAPVTTRWVSSNSIQIWHCLSRDSFTIHKLRA